MGQILALFYRGLLSLSKMDAITTDGSSTVRAAVQPLSEASAGASAGAGGAPIDAISGGAGAGVTSSRKAPREEIVVAIQEDATPAKNKRAPARVFEHNRDVSNARLLLCQLMPRAVADIVFEFSGHAWKVCAERRVSSSEADPTGKQRMNVLFLTVALPPHACKVTQLRVVVESKDQGWSSYRRLYATRTSNTWGELGLLERPQAAPEQAGQTAPEQAGQAAPEQAGQTAPVVAPTSDPEEYNAFRARSELTEFNRICCYRNLHAGQKYERQSVVYGMDDELVVRMRPEYELGLWLRSEYPAWCNFCRYALLEVSFLA